MKNFALTDKIAVSPRAAARTRKLAGKGTVLVTIVAMLALVFICLLFFNLFSQLVGFVYSLYKELALRT